MRVENICEVETISLNDILAEMQPKPLILSIDIEGRDHEVLQTLDFSVCQQLIIIAELYASGAREQHGKEITDFLQAHGYCMSVFSSELNGIFLRRDVAEIVEPMNRAFLRSCLAGSQG